MPGATWVLLCWGAWFATLTVGYGFMLNSATQTVGDDDADCGVARGPHDESERERNGCVKICEVHPQWYAWGRDRDCYWDDLQRDGEVAHG